jgi:hypothetical protein
VFAEQPNTAAAAGAIPARLAEAEQPAAIARDAKAALWTT